jgi:hypothetical protein
MKFFFDSEKRLHIDGMNARYCVRPSDLPLMWFDDSIGDFPIIVENFIIENWPMTRWQRFCVWLGGLT